MNICSRNPHKIILKIIIFKIIFKYNTLYLLRLITENCENKEYI